jgi:hypothetical protein
MYVRVMEEGEKTVDGVSIFHTLEHYRILLSTPSKGRVLRVYFDPSPLFLCEHTEGKIKKKSFRSFFDTNLCLPLKYDELASIPT